MNTTSIADRRAAFRELHREGCFLIPNPWDAGSARYLEILGFRALATTSSGFAFTKGLPDDDRAVTKEAMLAHFSELIAATTVPLNADFKSGYARDGEELHRNVRLCVETGVAGLSIEDSTGDDDAPLYEFSLAVERIRIARKAIDETGSGVLLTARAECFLTGHPDPLPEALKRLVAFAEAGADVLYAPGPQVPAQIREIIQAVKPKPVNVLVGTNSGLTVGALAGLGARRISVGSALARAAMSSFIRAAETMLGSGSFAGLDGAISFREINRTVLQDWLTRR